MEAALGWAELSLKGSAFFLLSAALCLPTPPCRKDAFVSSVIKKDHAVPDASETPAACMP